MSNVEGGHLNVFLRECLEDLVNINAYVRGTNPEIDQALEKIEAVNRYLRQGMAEAAWLDQSLRELQEIFAA